MVNDRFERRLGTDVLALCSLYLLIVHTALQDGFGCHREG